MYKTFLTAFCVVAVLLTGCRRASDEELLREAVSRAVQAAERKDVPGFMKAVSKDYYDENGNDRDAIKGMLLYRFMGADKIVVLVRDLSVKVEGERASAEARVAVLRGGEMKDAEGLRISVIFRKEKGGWMAVTASWAPIGLTGLI